MQIFRLLIDFGLVVLIWMTQLIVYPGFGYYPAEDLIRWHGKYTVAISVIVAPLMIAQVLIHGWNATIQPNILNWISVFLIFLIWINTFAFAVPLHNQISSGIHVMDAAQRLVGVNWYRTLLWSILFLLTLYEFLK